MFPRKEQIRAFRQKHIKKSKERKSDILKFPESELAHKYLDNLYGIEIGGSSHNKFGLNTLNIDYTREDTSFSQASKNFGCETIKVDIVASGDNLPFKDDVWDFVINSHVIEHFFDPIATIEEWLRVVKPNGYIFMIVPHKERTFDADRDITNTQELIDRHSGKIPAPEYDDHRHWSVWNTKSFIDFCEKMNWNVIEYQDVDDKVGNGFTIVLQKK